MRVVFFTLIFALAAGAGLPAQPVPHGGRIVPGTQGDSAIADRYLQWAEQAIKDGQWLQARNALERAADFSDVSSDIPYLLALARFNTNESRGSVLQAIENALRVGRWNHYSEARARLLEAEQLIAMRRYSAALDSLAAFRPSVETADAAILRLAALKGLVSSGSASYSAEFRRRMTETLNRYPRDTRALRLLFDYANYAYADGRTPNNDDITLMVLALDRLPFLLPTDPELAWISAPFDDIERARQSLADYRGSSSKPNPASLVPALNLGLLDDIDAVEELFTPEYGVKFVIDKDLVVNVWKLLRSEEGRDHLARKLRGFSGIITEDPDHDGYAESRAVYKEGVLEEYAFDADQDRIDDMTITFNSGKPQWSRLSVSLYALPQNGDNQAQVFWESYPSVQRAVLGNALYLPAPGDLKFIPLGFTELCASDTKPGLKYPQLNPFRQEINRRMLASFAVSVQQPSVEFEGGVEHISLENGIPLRAKVMLDNKIVSFTEFENGRPVAQWLDLDLDGRMETVRHFRGNIYTGRSALSWDELQIRLSDRTDLRRLLESSESDWNGDGIFESGELYREDGSVVNKWNLTNQ